MEDVSKWGSDLPSQECEWDTRELKVMVSVFASKIILGDHKLIWSVLVIESK